MEDADSQHIRASDIKLGESLGGLSSTSQGWTQMAEGIFALASVGCTA
jgi:hypothetical protein